MEECYRCKEIRDNRLIHTPISFANWRTILYDLLTAAFCSIIVSLFVALCVKMSFGKPFFPVAYDAFIIIFAAILFIGLLIFCFISGSTFVRNNIIGRTIVCSKDEKGVFHKHLGPDTVDGEYISYRVGGYFRSLGSLSPSRREWWKVVESWDGYNVILADKDGGRISVKSYELLKPLVYEVTKMPYLDDYLDKHSRCSLG